MGLAPEMDRKLSAPAGGQWREGEWEIDNLRKKAQFQQFSSRFLRTEGLNIEISQSRRSARRRCKVIQSRTLFLNTITGLAVPGAISLIADRH